MTQFIYSVVLCMEAFVEEVEEETGSWKRDLGGNACKDDDCKHSDWSELAVIIDYFD